MELTNEEKAEILWAIQEWNLPSWEEMGFEYIKPVGCLWNNYYEHTTYHDLRFRNHDPNDPLYIRDFSKRQEFFILLLIRLAMDLEPSTFKVASMDRNSGAVEVTDKGSEWVKEILNNEI